MAGLFRRTASLPCYRPGMHDDSPHTIGDTIDEVLIRRMPPDLLDRYYECKRRHRDELREIERLARRAKAFLRRWSGQARDEKETELCNEKAERIRQENERFGRQVRELIAMWRDRTDEQGA